MNELIHADISALEPLSLEEMCALTGGTGFRYEWAASTGTNHNL
jgi:hypothetical protein